MSKLLALPAIVLLAACSNSEVESQLAELRKETQALKEQITLAKAQHDKDIKEAKDAVGALTSAILRQEGRIATKELAASRVVVTGFDGGKSGMILEASRDLGPTIHVMDKDGRIRAVLKTIDQDGAVGFNLYGANDEIASLSLFTDMLGASSITMRSKDGKQTFSAESYATGQSRLYTGRVFPLRR